MRVYDERVPKEKLQQFHEILCSTGGRYLYNPQDYGEFVRVSYEPGNYSLQMKLWEQCTTSIREVKKNQWWRIALRRIGRVIKN